MDAMTQPGRVEEPREALSGLRTSRAAWDNLRVIASGGDIFARERRTKKLKETTARD